MTPGHGKKTIGKEPVDLKRIRLAQIYDNGIIHFFRVLKICPSIPVNNRKTRDFLDQSEPEFNLGDFRIQFHIIDGCRMIFFNLGHHTAFSGDQKDIFHRIHL